MTTTSDFRWPPGPRAGFTGWNLLAALSRDILAAYAGWRDRYGDVFHLHIWPEHQIVVADPELVRELLVRHQGDLVRWERGIEVFSHIQGNSVMVAEGEAWRTKREALQPGFAPGPVQQFTQSMVATSRRALAEWPADSPSWPVETALTSLTMDVIMRMLFSSAIDEDMRTAERAVHTIAVAGNAEMFWPKSWPDWMPWKRQKRAAIRFLRGMIDRQIQARLAQPEAQPPQDLLARLLALHHAWPDQWPLHAVSDECMTAFLAGHDTTAATLTWWTWCMAANPAVQAKARAEVALVLGGALPDSDSLTRLPVLTSTLRETLRLYPTAPLLMARRADKPLTLGPWRLPARTMFMVPVQLLHHDRRWFPEPQLFRPERFAPGGAEIPRGAYLPFGTGGRVCLGQHLAMTEMTVIAAMLLQRYVIAPLDGAVAPQPIFTFSLRPAKPLAVKLQQPEDVC